MTHKIAPCRRCGKETYNETKEWTGYCSPACQKEASQPSSRPMGGPMTAIPIAKLEALVGQEEAVSDGSKKL